MARSNAAAGGTAVIARNANSGPVSERARELQERMHAAIPGGAHTYAKGDDQYPANAPPLLVRGQGCRVWDVDGTEFTEYGMGLRAVTLGHAYPSVVRAAYEQMLLGSNFTRPAPIELECAELLRELVDPGAMVKFAKTGSEATTAAVKLARAVTGRDLVAICAQQPFFSIDDWFIGSTAMAAGIPEVVRSQTKTFDYNDVASVEALFAEYPGQIACVVLEPATAALQPRDAFLQELRRLCTANGAILVFDEMITGFRWHLGGAQFLYDVQPDLSAFGKAMANGFSLAALVGRRDLMERGGIRHDQERVFLLSTTHGAEAPALAAALETMRIFRDEGVVEVLYRRGERLREGVTEVSESLGLAEHFGVTGPDSNLVYFTRDASGAPSQAFRALFMQELIRGGVLAPSFVVSYSHTEEDVDATVQAVERALGVYGKALEDGVERWLLGPPVKPVFRKYC